MSIVERSDAVCGGWDFLPSAERNLQPRSRIGGSAWIELQNGRNLSKYLIESDVKDTVKGY
jgi:hypothetical protein